MNDFKNLEDKIKKLDQKKPDSDQNRQSSMGIAMKLSSEMIAAVFVASFIGYYLDKWLETKPFLLIFFFFLGAIPGIFNFLRTFKMFNKD